MKKMTSLPSEFPTITRIKQRAKQLKKSLNISQAEAYRLLSQHYGYCNWEQFKRALDDADAANIPLPLPSTNFAADEDVQMNDNDYEMLDEERAEDLPFDTKLLVIENKKQLTRLGIEYAVFEPTQVGLKKSILDATQPIRALFVLENFHFYDQQKQGTENRIL